MQYSQQDLYRAIEFCNRNSIDTIVDVRIAELIAQVRAETFDQFWDYIAAHYDVPTGKYTPVELIQALDKTIRTEINARLEQAHEAALPYACEAVRKTLLEGGEFAETSPLAELKKAHDTLIGAAYEEAAAHIPLECNEPQDWECLECKAKWHGYWSEHIRKLTPASALKALAERDAKIRQLAAEALADPLNRCVKLRKILDLLDGDAIRALAPAAVDECERRQAMRIADAVAEEREECAKTCMSNVLSEEQMNGEPNFHIGEMCLRLCHERDAAAIRARGQKAEEKR